MSDITSRDFTLTFVTVTPTDYTQLQQSLDDAEEFLSSGNPFLGKLYPTLH